MASCTQLLKERGVAACFAAKLGAEVAMLMIVIEKAASTTFFITVTSLSRTSRTNHDGVGGLAIRVIALYWTVVQVADRGMHRRLLLVGRWQTRRLIRHNCTEPKSACGLGSLQSGVSRYR